MIRDNIKNLSRYSFIHKDMDKVLEFLANINNMEIGRYQITDDVYMFVQEANTKQEPDFYFEAHKNYMDIQLLLEGEETIYYNSVENCDVAVEYAPEKDIMFYNANTKKYLEESILYPGDFAVYFADEPHCPACSNNNPSKIKKAVVKLKVK